MGRRLVLRGNFVVPSAESPFAPGNSEGEDPLANSNVGSRGALGVQDIGPSLQLHSDHVMVVAEGIIEHFEHSFTDASCEVLSSLKQDDKNVEFLDCRSSDNGSTQFVCPGFVDLHIHAPQYSYAGTATDRPLLGADGWLESYAFPAETTLAQDLDRARRVYTAVLRATLGAGTTTAVYFATLHLPPCQVLVDLALECGQRAFVGKVCMDRNSPPHYCQSLDTNVRETEQLIQYIHAKAGRELPDCLLPLVMPIITPRFIPTCSPQLLQRLGDLASQHNCHVQSHLSESIDEVAFTRSLHEQDYGASTSTNSSQRDGLVSDASIFNSHGLLTSRCIMAHAVYLTVSDADLMRTCGAAVAHCPLSNFYFAGASLPCRRLLQRGNRVGLGTDIAGGYSPSLLDSARMAVVASRALQQSQDQHGAQTSSNDEPQPIGARLPVRQGEDNSPTQSCSLLSPPRDETLDYRHAFWLATMGGALSLGLQHRIGTFAPGMEFDAVILSAPSNCIFPEDHVLDVFQKVCTRGDDRCVRAVFVQGVKIDDEYLGAAAMGKKSS